jgi:hypothetical protein
MACPYIRHAMACPYNRHAMACPYNSCHGMTLQIGRIKIRTFKDLVSRTRNKPAE